MTQKLRNIAIIAHVDHGKTTLVDKLLEASGTLDQRGEAAERVMDSNDLERERGITILAKNTAVNWKDHRINIVDTPGHADFGGEVERVLSMVDSVLLLVDAVDGPMPQTRFVTQKAFDQGLNPIVVINKIDRDGARPDWVLDQTFDLFDRLGATDEQLDFPVIYASALQGYCGEDADVRSGNMDALLDAILEKVPAPDVDPEGPFRMQISSLDYNNYVGVIGIGRVERGRAKNNQAVTIVGADGKTRNARILQLYNLLGLQRLEIEAAQAGDIIAISGAGDLDISDTLCAQDAVEALKPLSVDEPTVSMIFQVNDSPFAGQDGKYITTRNLLERFEQELRHNVALRVEPQPNNPDQFLISGRGELHLSILIENMRREGYELAVSRPQVITREENGRTVEPFEQLTIDVEEQHQGAVMEVLGARKGELTHMDMGSDGRVRIDYIIPARSLIGFRTDFLSMTSGSGLMYHVFERYDELKGELPRTRNNGVMISNTGGKAVGYSMFNLQERGRMFCNHGEDIYEGMIIGIHNRDNDLTVNPSKAKQLTNVRASGTDENIILTPPIKFSLEQAMAFVDDDELLEVTPSHLRLRKKFLKEHERKRASRG